MAETVALNSLRGALKRALRPRAIGRSAMALVAMMLACQAGCSVCQQARRTIFQEPSEFSWRYDRGRSIKVYRQWADEAWAAESGACPELAGADDYALGFRDGFVDFVYAGGAGEPPPVPPRKFWNVGWRTPAGADGAEQWFGGYRHGAQTARNGGYRQNGVVHSAYLASEGAWVEGELPRTPLPEEVEAPLETLPPPLGDQPHEDPVDAVPADELPVLEMPEAGDEPNTTGAALGPVSATQRFRSALSVVRSHEASNPQ